MTPHDVLCRRAFLGRSAFGFGGLAATLLSRLRNGADSHPADDAFSLLTPQEDRILDFIADGLTNREIGERLHLSEKTVKNYVSQIYSKLNIERRSQAAALATERRLRKT